MSVSKLKKKKKKKRKKERFQYEKVTKSQYEIFKLAMQGRATNP